MMISRKSLLALATVLSAPLSIEAANYLYTDFAASIPKSYTIEKRDENTLQSSLYRNVRTNNCWVHGRVGTHGFAALCLTAGTSAEPQSNWLITPEVTIDSEDAVVRWDARSLVAELPENYEVMVKSSDSEQWDIIFAVEGEEDVWDTYIVPIPQYNGSDIQVAFVATTPSGYMLAIDNITVGVLKDRKYDILNHTPHYVASDLPKVKVCGEVHNYGVYDPDLSVILKCGESEYSSTPKPEGYSYLYEFNLPIEEGETLDYKIYVQDGEGERTELASEWMTCSAYKRMPILDRASGIWCTNCPGMEIVAREFEHRFAEEMAVLELHVNDALASDYLQCFTYINAVPHLIVNHNKETYTGDPEDATLWQEIRRGADAGLSLSASVDAQGEVTLTTSVEMAQATDNSADRYRLAYLMLADVHDPRNSNYIQNNGSATYQDEKFYYLPTYVPAHMMWYNNVPVEASTALSGVPGSLPQTMDARTEYEHTYTMTLPENDTYTNHKVLAYLLDTETGYVMNSAIAYPEGDSAVESLTDTSSRARVCVSGNLVQVTGAAKVKIYDLAGRVVSNSALSILPRGIYIVLADGRSSRIAIK